MHFPHDPILRRELPFIAQIIRDETWLESERRGCPVPSHDPVVRANVCEVVLRIGAELRARLSASENSTDRATNSAASARHAA